MIEIFSSGLICYVFVGIRSKIVEGQLMNFMTI